MEDVEVLAFGDATRGGGVASRCGESGKPTVSRGEMGAWTGELELNVDNVEGDSVGCGTDEVREFVLLNPLSPCVVLDPKALSNERSCTPVLG